MDDGLRLPIKVVPALENDYYRPDAGGGPPKVFCNVTLDVREWLVDQVLGVRDHFREAFAAHPGVPAVARARVRGDAVAKTHRPTHIFRGDTCPIIGAEGLGQLLVSVTLAGLDSLAHAVEHEQSQKAIANISTLESFNAYAPRIEIPQPALDDCVLAKVNLFLHRIATGDVALERAFRQILTGSSVKDVKEIHYGPGLKVYRVIAGDSVIFQALSSFVGTQSIGAFPVYVPVRTTAVAVRGIRPDDFPPPEATVEYPVVGVIDSGTAALDPLLGAWVIAREEYVPMADQDNAHGSFVSGLIAQGRRLNHQDGLFPSCGALILDVVAIDKNGTSEDELVTILEDALRKHPEVRIWNLSLGTETPCDDARFSDFAVALDRMQDEFGVTFVLAAGNYRRPPFRGWPPEDLSGADRICAPADSVRAVVVGSVAHRDHASSRVKAGHPSPFTRRGPGPLHLPKPEISHIGGNCDDLGVCSQIGVISIDGKGNIAEDMGTSFATPLISALAANIQSRIEGGASRMLTRALLVHSAALKTGRLDSTTLRYQGFGVPRDIDDILGCEPWQATMIFELQLEQNLAFQKAVFPMPACLYTDGNTVRADILMTLVYEPELDASFVSEYCRSNIEVSLGTYGLRNDGKYHHKKRVPQDPHLAGRGYEKDLVANGFKWSAVKVYRCKMVRGISGQRWRLDMSVHHRTGHFPSASQSAVLVITVADPNKAAPVYNEMVVQMNSMGWATQDLQIRPRLRA